MPHVSTSLSSEKKRRFDDVKEQLGATNAEIIPYMIEYALDENPKKFSQNLINIEPTGREHRIQVTIPNHSKEQINSTIIPQKELLAACIRFSLYYYESDFGPYFCSETVDDEFREKHYGTPDEPEKVDEIYGDSELRSMSADERRTHVMDDIDQLGEP